MRELSFELHLCVTTITMVTNITPCYTPTKQVVGSQCYKLSKLFDIPCMCSALLVNNYSYIASCINFVVQILG